MKNSSLAANCCAFLILAVLLVQAQGLHFQFQNFSNSDLPNLILSSGDSILAHGAIQVTLDSNGTPMTNLAGRVVYRKLFRLYKNGEKANFNSTFVLNIKNQTSTGGEGLAFILAADSSVPDQSYGQWLGIVNSRTNSSAEAKIVAVEFDTSKSYPDDLDDNHVGLDVNSVYSRKQAPLSSRGIDLSNGTNVKVLVRYDGHNLTVFLNEDMENPVISEAINLSEFLPEMVYVGFSASTSDQTQLNCVKSWEFVGSRIEGSNWWWVILVAVIVSALVAGTVVGIAYFFCWKRKYEMTQVEDAYPNIDLAIQGFSTAPRKFNLKQLKKATGNFNPKNKLGKGGFGTVYKGILGGREVAVKKVSKTSTQGKKEFIAEVTTIGNLNHRNLNKLIGWCYEKLEYLLVYEYMPNGSLDKFIFYDDKKSGMKDENSTLGWKTRLTVISGVAQSLDYLHNGCAHTILHRDIKASNIMLDSEFNAKLGDFGLARTMVQNNQTHHTTKELAGTPGYMAPEIILTRRATVETDAYAFGVLILEVFCGRKPGGQPEQNDYLSNIVHGVWEFHKRGMILSAADPRLNGEFDKVEMECMLILGLGCCHPNPNKRPTMKLVLQVLSGEAPPPELPTERPAFMWPPDTAQEPAPTTSRNHRYLTRSKAALMSFLGAFRGNQKLAQAKDKWRAFQGDQNLAQA